MEITSIQAKEILDSRGIPTISCDIILDDQSFVTASVPSGTSIGKYEAIERRDSGKRLEGQGVLSAVETINTIIGPNFIGKEPNAVNADLEMTQMDGSMEKSVLGANATLAVSMAMYRAHALIADVELYNLIAMVSGANTVSLPIPMVNVINGGQHADNNLDIQEYLLIPYAAQNLRSSIESSLEVFYKLHKLLKSNCKSTQFGLEGGFASNFENNVEPFDFILQAIEGAGLQEKFLLGIDAAATNFYDAQRKLYHINSEYKDSSELIEWYATLLKQYNLYALEDGLQQDDIEGWVKLTKTFGTKLCIMADDIFATNPARIVKGLEYGICNSVVIKPNQIGTITETLQAIQICKESGLATVTACRSGETTDTFIVDLAVGASTNYIKCGGFHGSEHTEKYNRLLEIEAELNGLVMSE